MNGHLARRAILAASIALPASSVFAQGTADLVGTWRLVSSVSEKDGKTTDQFGTGADGMMSLDANGRFMLTIIGPDLPKFAASNRAGGTEQENRAVVGRSIAMLGTFAVDPAGKTLTFKVERATFPNWDGTEQQRLIVVANSEELKYVTPTASSGGIGTVTWRRLK